MMATFSELIMWGFRFSFSPSHPLFTLITLALQFRLHQYMLSMPTTIITYMHSMRSGTSIMHSTRNSRVPP